MLGAALREFGLESKRSIDVNEFIIECRRNVRLKLGDFALFNPLKSSEISWHLGSKLSSSVRERLLLWELKFFFFVFLSSCRGVTSTSGRLCSFFLLLRRVVVLKSLPEALSKHVHLVILMKGTTLLHGGLEDLFLIVIIVELRNGISESRTLVDLLVGLVELIKLTHGEF